MFNTWQKKLLEFFYVKKKVTFSSFMHCLQKTKGFPLLTSTSFKFTLVKVKTQAFYQYDAFGFLWKKKANSSVMFVPTSERKKKILETFSTLFLSFWFIMVASVKSERFNLTSHQFKRWNKGGTKVDRTFFVFKNEMFFPRSPRQTKVFTVVLFFFQSHFSKTLLLSEKIHEL